MRREERLVIEMLPHPKTRSFTLAREIVIYENIRHVFLLDLTADFGVKTNANLTRRAFVS